MSEAFLVGGIDLPGLVRLLGPVSGPGLGPSGPGRRQVVAPQPALEGPLRGHLGFRFHPNQLDQDTSSPPAGMLTAEIQHGSQKWRSRRWVTPTGMVLGHQL
jgi:hypothetical protein